MADRATKEKRWDIPTPFGTERVSAEGGWGTLPWAKAMYQKVLDKGRESIPFETRAVIFVEMCQDVVKKEQYLFKQGGPFCDDSFLEMIVASWADEMLKARLDEAKDLGGRTRKCFESGRSEYLVSRFFQDYHVPLEKAGEILKKLGEYRDVLFGPITDFERPDKL